MDTNSLKPIEHILRSDTALDAARVSKVLDQILAAPAAATSTAKDIEEYVVTVNMGCSRVLKSRQPDAEKQLVESTRIALGYFASTPDAVQTTLSQQLFFFYSTLNTAVGEREWDDD